MENQFCSYTIRLLLTKFSGARVVEMEDANGMVTKHVCIPMDENDLRMTKGGSVAAYFFMSEMNYADQFGWTHILKQKNNKDYVKKKQEMGIKSLYMGNARVDNYMSKKYKAPKRFIKTSDYE